MATPTYDLIASSVLSSSAATVTFASIPQTYKDLVLVANTTSSNATNGSQVIVNFNNDASASSYLREVMYGQGTATAAVASNGTYGYMNIQTSSGPIGNTRAMSVLNIFNYRGGQHINCLYRSGRAENGTEAGFWRYFTTDPLTEIDIAMNTGYLFTAGSSFYLYGIVG